MSRRASKPMLSVVFPAYNEQGNVTRMLRGLKEVLANVINYEVIWVDDGSTDKTLSVIKQEAARDERVSYISLSRNFGHQSAIKAGVDVAAGDCVVTMDADGEHPPEMILRMLQLWQDGFDVVFTKRLDHAQIARHKRWLRKPFYWLMQQLSSLPIEHGTADFRLLDRKVVDACRQFDEKDMFWRGLIAWLGFKQAFFTYEQGVRGWGESKYGLKKMLNFSITGLTSFSTKPLYLGIFTGAVFAVLAFGYAGYAVFIRLFTDQGVSGWASLLASFMFISGVQLILMGIIGVYVGKVFDEVKQRPQYVIRDAKLKTNDQTPSLRLPGAG